MSVRTRVHALCQNDLAEKESDLAAAAAEVRRGRCAPAAPVWCLSEDLSARARVYVCMHVPAHAWVCGWVNVRMRLKCVMARVSRAHTLDFGI